MTQIKSVIFSDSEAWLMDNLRDFAVDGTSSVFPASQFDGAWGRSYVDEIEQVTKYAPFSRHVHALRLLCELIDNKKLFVGGVACAMDLVDPCNWDVEVVDAYFQLIYHGEVIYG